MSFATNSLPSLIGPHHQLTGVTLNSAISQYSYSQGADNPLCASRAPVFIENI